MVSQLVIKMMQDQQTIATDVAKMIQAPVIHVNGDDPEMVVNAVKIATKYRNQVQ